MDEALKKRARMENRLRDQGTKRREHEKATKRLQRQDRKLILEAYALQPSMSTYHIATLIGLSQPMVSLIIRKERKGAVING